MFVTRSFSRCSRLLKSGGLLLLPLLYLPIHSAAQEPATAQSCSDVEPRATLGISGVILDASGARLSGATVRARCGRFFAETKSGERGEYRLMVPSGSLSIEVSLQRFHTVTRQIRITTDPATRTVDVTLTLSEVRSSIDVVAHVPYLDDETPAGTKSNVDILEVPQAITVVSRRLLDEQGAVKLDDALKNVAGVVPGGYYDGWDYYRIRGFDASFNTYLDGLRGGNGTADEVWGLEAVDVLKGPSSALYGQSVLGGLVNLRSKQPRPDAFANLEFTAGSFGYWMPALDAGASLNRRRSLYGRLVVLHRHQDSFVDYANKDRTYVAPSLTWRIGGGTTFTILSRYQLENGRHAFPLPAAGTVIPNVHGEIPISRYIGETADNVDQVHEDNKHIGYQFTHRFNDAWSFHQNFRFTDYRQDWRNLLYPAYLDEDQRTLYRYPLDYYQRWKTYAVDSRVEAAGNTGRLRHDFLAGYDYFRNPNSYSGVSIDYDDPSQYMPIDVFRPVYGAAQFSATLIPAYDGRSITQFHGIYLQDHVNLTDRISLTAGGRFNFSQNRDLPDPGETQSAFTPRLGGTYRLFPGAFVYGSYSRSYLPQSGRVFDTANETGRLAPPEEGAQWEGGFKSALWGNRLFTTVAIFNLERSNVLTSDAAHPNFYLVTGNQRSRGVELEAAYTIRTGWNMTAAYSYIDAKVTEDNDIPSGTRTQNAPRNTFSTWMRYEIQRGFARGLAFGAGGRYYTDQAGDLYDTFRIGSYGLADASVSYHARRFYIQLNAYNLTNTRYFTGSYDIVYVKPGPPRSARVTVGFRF